ncbi:hypothetical protein F5I97DRAFT_1950306 [Phlebopus sp. FC_14]|nr:hypothetical protein F5I97DRAFT_1950306 [Phlebopus sp. FC_14]
MSEYWVSHKRYHCKYCNIYVADDKPSRTQHENGLRHKGNVERFVRSLYKEGEKRVREREEEKGVMAGVSRAAEAAYVLDVASGRASTSSVAASSPPAPKAKPVKPSNPYANYTTAASLGYGDPDAEEAERRMGTGIPGQWTVVRAAPPAPVPASASVTESQGAGDLKREVGMALDKSDKDMKKRPLSTADHDSEDTRTFKLRKKTVGVGLGDIYDPGIIAVKPKPHKKEEDVVVQSRPGARMMNGMNGVKNEIDETADTSQPSSLPSWTKVRWKKASDDTPASAPESPSVTDASADVPLPSALAPLMPTTTFPELSKDTVTVKPHPLNSALNTSFPTLIMLSPTAADGVKEEEQAEGLRLTDTDIDTVPAPPPSQATSLFRKRKLPAGRRGV